MASPHIYIIQVLQILFLFLAGFFAIETVIILRLHHGKGHHKKEPGRCTYCRMFPLLMIGVITLTIAYSMKHVYSYIFSEAIPLVSDLFFIISYITLIIAFSMFWIETRKTHDLHMKENFFFVGVVSMVLIWLYFFFTKVLGPGTVSLPSINLYLTYFYPAAAAFLFFSTLIIYPRFKENKHHSPLWYLSSGVFLNFLAEMMYIYTKWQLSAVFIETIYTVLFMFSALYFMLGFYVAYKKYR